VLNYQSNFVELAHLSEVPSLNLIFIGYMEPIGCTVDVSSYTPMIVHEDFRTSERISIQSVRFTTTLLTNSLPEKKLSPIHAL